MMLVTCVSHVNAPAERCVWFLCIALKLATAFEGRLSGGTEEWRGRWESKISLRSLGAEGGFSNLRIYAHSRHELRHQVMLL
jgi:hypothetical protein